ncbi:hypothetical protein [Actinocorallia sp. A-T 12471]|uniref:hypothetical protein n=1 Tax=Actinocorallia sp. A-T 12471 TaxID=3089813 RepID=UPI0029CBDBB7|nr:hypothetical protein [Actinocorallia sp. A-T 12471]MDX6740157.1 hypothetical protein [Actinocorallia sp. A-T 12471]
MGELATSLRERISAARRNLAEARASGDGHGEDTYTAELEDLRRRAEDHGVAVDDPEGTGA